MRIKNTDTNFTYYKIYLGEKEIKDVVEASEEEGWIYHYADPHNYPNYKKKLFGKVFIVRIW